MKNSEGEVIGAVGVSGASEDVDEYSAWKGIVDSGFDI